jgi:type III pantothenate kinase
MNLCIDIGNTRVKMALFSGDEIQLIHKTELLDFDLINVWLKEFLIEKCILSSTRNIEEYEMKHLKSILPKLFVLDHETPLPVKSIYETPQTLGKDRIAAAVAAHSLFPEENVIIIDCGTCLTYNFIDDQGVFMGGNIAPGVSMRLESMHHFTDKLPLVEKEYNEGLFGQNTVKAMQNGALKGAIYEISSFIESVLEKFGGAKIILTGGDSILFAKHLNFKIFAFPNLVLFGLNKILMFIDNKIGRH